MQTREAVFDAPTANAIQHRHGLFIGIDHYKDPNITADGCALDALRVSEAFAPILSSNKLITDEQATQPVILAELEKMVNTTQEGDLAIFYHSGRAETAYNRYFLLPHEYEHDYHLGSMCPFDTVLDVLAAGPCHSLIIVDAPNAGAVGFDVATFRNASSSILVACAPNEDSHSYFADGEERGVFSAAITNAIGAACDGRRALTLIELYEQVYAETKERLGELQHPILIGTLDYRLVIVDLKADGYA